MITIALSRATLDEGSEAIVYLLPFVVFLAGHLLSVYLTGRRAARRTRQQPTQA